MACFLRPRGDVGAAAPLWACDGMAMVVVKGTAMVEDE